MKVVIVGCGRVGAALANVLADAGHEVSIIDQEERSFARLGKDSKANAMVGVGIDLDVLKEAGIQHADAFAAVTNGDNTNYMSSRLAKEFFQVPTVVARLYDPNRLPLFEEAGIRVMCSTIVGARALREMITGGTLGSHLLVNRKFVAEEILVEERDIGKTVAELGKKREATVVAVFRGSGLLPFQSDDLVHVGDVLLCVRPTMPSLGVSKTCMS